jgi:hypothetical protein
MDLDPQVPQYLATSQLLQLDFGGFGGDGQRL